MPIKAKSFEFLKYKFDQKNKKITFSYRINFQNQKPLNFKETLELPKKRKFQDLPAQVLKNLLESLHLILGISYYKLYCPKQVIHPYQLNKEQAEFWSLVYKKGLGEFFYVNKLDPKNSPKFKSTAKTSNIPNWIPIKDRAIVGMGGGKDSVLTAELLNKIKYEHTSFVLETEKGSELVDNVIQQVGNGSLKVFRYLDPKIFKEHPDSYNGHVPISAVFAFVGLLVCAFYDYKYYILSNEFSSNFGNIKYKGEIINHQWSKSYEFEKALQNYTKNYISPSITYFSILRPLYELNIVKKFAKYPRYFKKFSSCNRNFKVFKERVKNLWCCECPKCAFIFLMLSNFLDAKKLTSIFGENLLEKEELKNTYRDLFDLGKLKPLDCVGTFDESKFALKNVHPSFKKSLIYKTFNKKIKISKDLEKKLLQLHFVDTIPDRFWPLLLDEVLLVGHGREGQASENYLKKYYPKVKLEIADQKYQKNYLKLQQGHEFAIKTPGLPKDKMEIPYSTATNLFFSNLANQFTIAVTGSKGKSTTSSLVYHILKEAGVNVKLLGNIGEPMLNYFTKKKLKKNQVFVLELSSYQLDDIKYSPNIAVALNLFPEHMNYHGNVEKYYLAKKNITNFQTPIDLFIYNSKIPDLKKWAKETRAQTMSFNSQKFDLDKSSLPLIGQHNYLNILAAATAAHQYGIKKSTIKKAIKSFKGLSHRLEFIGEHKGIKFYDDAISTTPESTIEALKSLKNIGTIFLGGTDRGYDFRELEKEIKKLGIKNIVLFPDSGKKMFKSTKGLNILKTKSMKEAVKFAYANTSKEQICLLSTASPSYSLWKNFEHKGREFKEMVKKLA